jgi:hypothetical protein
MDPFPLQIEHEAPIVDKKLLDEINSKWRFSSFTKEKNRAIELLSNGLSNLYGTYPFYHRTMSPSNISTKSSSLPSLESPEKKPTILKINFHFVSNFSATSFGLFG